MWKMGFDFELNVFFPVKDMLPYIKSHERYQYSELKKIFSDTDILLAPSIWYETFGFTVLEALSFGVPVVISGTVGAKDILASGAGIVVEEMTVSKLKESLASLTQEKLEMMNAVIAKEQFIMTMPVLSNRITREIYNEEN